MWCIKIRDHMKTTINFNINKKLLQRKIREGRVTGKKRDLKWMNITS